MKIIFFITLMFSSILHAASYDIKMTCGAVSKARSGKLLRRLEPSFFGLNDKFVLRTRFENFVNVNEVGYKNVTPPAIDELTYENQVAYTFFSIKDKFKDLKKELRKEIREAKKSGTTLYACVGHIDVYPFKYTGSHVYYSHESLDDAVEKMRRQARRHL